MYAWSCRIWNQHRALCPLAELVSNPTPPGQITREPASLLGGRLGRVLCLERLTLRTTNTFCHTLELTLTNFPRTLATSKATGFPYELPRTNASSTTATPTSPANIIADLPRQYGKPEEYPLYKGDPNNDIQPVTEQALIGTIKKCHNTLWAGGNLSPLATS
jgi:hypothetical protein